MLEYLSECGCSLNSKSEPKGHVDVDVQTEHDDVEREMPNVKNGAYKIVANKLHKKYTRKHVAVDEFSLLVKPNECMVLLGTNGAGKTTTFNMMNGIVRPTSGET